MAWDYGTCGLCHGTGRIQGKKRCPVCDGYGLWEFEIDNNHLAVVSLTQGTPPANEHVKAICDRRLSQVNPDNLEAVLRLLENGSQSDFEALQDAGAKEWGWAWLHANRFAIELVKLCGGDPVKHRLACSMMARKWLSEENQKNIDAPIDKQK